MEYRKMYEDELTARMHEETAHMTLSEEKKKTMFLALQKKNNPIHRFLEREITIPVKTVIAACAIIIVVAVAVSIPLFRVSEKDLQENKVIIIQEGRV